MTERLNTLEAKVRTCLYSSVWQKFPRVAGEKDVRLAALERSSVCPSTHGKEQVVVLPQGRRAALLCTRVLLTSSPAPATSHAAAPLPPCFPLAARLSSS